MRILTVMVVLAVAGCAMTPTEIRQTTNDRETVVRPGKLSAVALCVTHGFDEAIQTQNDLRVDESSGKAEMIANASAAQGLALAAGSYAPGPVYVVDFKSIDAGTELTYYIRSDNFQRVMMRRKIREIINGC